METNRGMTVRFWGVRGSVPSPITGAEVENKVVEALALAAVRPDLINGSKEVLRAWVREHLPFEVRSTFGGNTTCVEIRCDDQLFILDMGTGLRELGVALMSEMFRNHGIKGTVLLSHVHWDHIQGYPFWAQLYMPRDRFKNVFTFYGGKDWDRSLEQVLRGQMNPPVFPVEHREIEQTAMQMKFHSVYDGMVIEMPARRGNVRIVCRKLNHPQETYGWRIEYNGAVVALTTDNEPYAGSPDRALVELATGADIWMQDCQHSFDEYEGKIGIPKKGWGHSFPEANAETAKIAKPRLIVNMHHDPGSSDERILALAARTQELCGIRTIAAYEGLSLTA
ncbi:MAG: MBL fold metallo-hydrolase [bacterium]|nr:MBL fold metallo-hydrolase [bacterium]